MNIKELDVKALSAEFDELGSNTLRSVERTVNERIDEAKRTVETLVDSRLGSSLAELIKKNAVDVLNAEVLVTQFAAIHPDYPLRGDGHARLQLGPLSFDLGSVKELSKFMQGGRVVLALYPNELKK
jgi:hypothetical protein